LHKEWGILNVYPPTLQGGAAENMDRNKGEKKQEHDIKERKYDHDIKERNDIKEKKYDHDIKERNDIKEKKHEHDNIKDRKIDNDMKETEQKSLSRSSVPDIVDIPKKI